MFSLRTKLTIALMVTSLAAALLVGAVAEWQLSQKFGSMAMRESFDAFQADVAAYFTTYGSWDNGWSTEPFDQFMRRRHMLIGQRRPPRGGSPLRLPPPPSGTVDVPPVPPPPDGAPPPPPGERERPPFLFLLLDPGGRVLMGQPPYERGDTAPAELRETGMPINVGGEVVAIAVPLDTPNLNEFDRGYLIAVRESLVFGIVAAALMALGLGLIFGSTLSSALRRLTAASRAIAGGDLRQRVKVRSRDEIGILAETFNRMSADLERSTEELKEAVKLREEVDRIARHDIKTPLNTIIGVPRLLRDDGNLSDENKELLGIVERAGYRILNMVNLSLDLYRMEQGTYQVRPQVVNIAHLLDTVITDVRTIADAREVNVRIEQSRPAHAWAEQLLSYSLLANLLKNAVEASPENATVRVRVHEADDLVVIEIHNIGAVPAKVRERFFEKYATTGKSGGTGLGAYSARLMARVQHGEITMRSSDEDGTTMTVQLPAAPMASSSSAAADDAGETIEESVAELPAARILLVDDDEYNRLIISRYLPAPLQVEAAANGRAAVEASLARPADVILMDLEMPGLNGLEATKTVREQEEALGRQPCVIIALSSHDDEEKRQQCRAAGCDLYLTKPVTRGTLQATLRELALTGRVSWRSKGEELSDAVPDAAYLSVEVDPDLKDILPAFLESRRAALDDMRRALRDGDAILVRRLAHRLAGSFGLYGFRWAADHAHKLDREVQSGNLQAMIALVDELQRHLQTVEIRCGGAIFNLYRQVEE